MLPPIIPEQIIHRFKFINTSLEVKEGMWHSSELYSNLTSFPVEQRQKAYALALGLSQHDCDVLITHSKETYEVWVSLRSPISPSIPVPQDHLLPAQPTLQSLANC